MQLPSEIVRQVIREATRLPFAFDTDLDNILNESRAAVYGEIYDSYALKSALSLVSKEFHSVTDQFLYEIVVIRSYFHLWPVLQQLQRKEDDTTRGWYVRRLDIDLGSENHSHDGWSWGKNTLWGLLPACPNLEVLICSLVIPYHFVPDRSSIPIIESSYFDAPTTLLQSIATTPGPRLRRLELLGQMAVCADEAETLVQRLPKLEVCRFAGLREPVPPFGVMGLDWNGDVEEWDSLADLQPELHRVVSAHKTFSWPAGSPPTGLHTLDCGEYVRGMTDWQIPSLRSLTARLSRWRGTNQLPILRASIHDHTAKHSFASITHLAHSGPAFDVWSVIDCLPNLQWLGLDLPRLGVQQGSGPSQPHNSLSTIVLRASVVPDSENSTTQAFPKSVLRAKREGLLTEFKTLRLVGLADAVNAEKIEQVRVKFENVGVGMPIVDEVGSYERGATLWTNYVDRISK